MLKRLWARGNLEVENRTKTSNQYRVIEAAYSTVVSSWPWGAQVADQKIIYLIKNFYLKGNQVIWFRLTWFFLQSSCTLAFRGVGKIQKFRS